MPDSMGGVCFSDSMDGFFSQPSVQMEANKQEKQIKVFPKVRYNFISILIPEKIVHNPRSAPSDLSSRSGQGDREEVSVSLIAGGSQCVKGGGRSKE
jgi:hypothetical protein